MKGGGGGGPASGPADALADGGQPRPEAQLPSIFHATVASSGPSFAPQQVVSRVSAKDMSVLGMADSETNCIANPLRSNTLFAL